MFSRTGASAIKPDLNTKKYALCLATHKKNLNQYILPAPMEKVPAATCLLLSCNHADIKQDLYTSPHLKDFRERIKINGEMIPEDFIVGFTENIKPLIEDINPSFFEITARWRARTSGAVPNVPEGHVAAAGYASTTDGRGAARI